MRKRCSNFQLNRTTPGWHITFLAEDAKISIEYPATIRDMETLLRVIKKLGGNKTRARVGPYNWGQGSEWIEPSPARCKALGIEYP